MLSLSRCEGYADYPLLWRGHETKEGWTISILSSMGTLELMIGRYMLMHTMPFTWWKSNQEEKLHCLFSEEAEAGYHDIPALWLWLEKGRVVIKHRESQRLVALLPCASLQTSLSLHIFCLLSPSQRVSTRFIWGNGPISALKAALKRKCFVKERDSKISGPSYGIWFTKPLLSAKYLLADQVQSPLWD